MAPLASHIEDLQRKFEMRVLNRYLLCKNLWRICIALSCSNAPDRADSHWWFDYFVFDIFTAHVPAGHA